MNKTLQHLFPSGENRWSQAPHYHLIRQGTFRRLAFVFAALLATPVYASGGTFYDDFTSQLDPAWTVEVEPLNHGAYSLTANPGHLRMQQTKDGQNSGDNSLRIYRSFVNGTGWTMEFYVDYGSGFNTSGTQQGRQQSIQVQIADTVNSRGPRLTWYRDKDCCSSPSRDRIATNISEPGFTGPSTAISPGGDQFYVRMSRSGDDVTIEYKRPGDANYTVAVTYTFQGTVGSTNWVYLIGTTHASEDSYADYDYIKVTSVICQLYAVHDEKRNDSQFFTVNPNTLEVNALGEMYENHDIEALDIHPQTEELYAASGDDTRKNKKGYLYKVDKANGELTDVGPTGCKEVDALSFHPDGTLWGWAQDCGLLTINTSTGKADVIIPASQVEVEDITWNMAGTTLYGVENLHGNHHPDSHGADEDDYSSDLDFDQGVRLWAYNSESDIGTVCDDITQSLVEIEALETLPDDSLLFGFHGIEGILNVGALDVQNCQLIAQDELPTVPYNDVEGIAWPANACE